MVLSGQYQLWNTQGNYLYYISLKQLVDIFFYFIQWENLVNKQTNWLDIMDMKQ